MQSSGEAKRCGESHLDGPEMESLSSEKNRNMKKRGRDDRHIRRPALKKSKLNDEAKREKTISDYPPPRGKRQRDSVGKPAALEAARLRGELAAARDGGVLPRGAEAECVATTSHED